MFAIPKLGLKIGKVDGMRRKKCFAIHKIREKDKNFRNSGWQKMKRMFYHPKFE